MTARRDEPSSSVERGRLETDVMRFFFFFSLGARGGEKVAGEGELGRFGHFPTGGIIPHTSVWLQCYGISEAAC